MVGNNVQKGYIEPNQIRRLTSRIRHLTVGCNRVPSVSHRSSNPLPPESFLRLKMHKKSISDKKGIAPYPAEGKPSWFSNEPLCRGSNMVPYLKHIKQNECTVWRCTFTWLSAHSGFRDGTRRIRRTDIFLFSKAPSTSNQMNVHLQTVPHFLGDRL